MFKHVLGGSKLAKLAGLTLAAGVITAAFHTTAPVKASDHDDGETNIKARNLNLTDLYVFREDWQTGVVADNTNMVFIMNTNPRSLPRQQYFFNTNAVYSFFVSRRAGIEDAVTGVPDMAFDFNFGAPGANGVQAITLNIRRFNNGAEGTKETVSAGSTTAAAPLIGSPNPAPNNNNVVTANGNLTVFAGLREDPFFFDVDSYFRTRAFLASNGVVTPDRSGIVPPDGRGNGLIPGATDANAIDFAKGYNVNAIAVRIPIALLKGGTTNGVFDVWETIAVPDAFAALQ